MVGVGAFQHSDGDAIAVTADSSVEELVALVDGLACLAKLLPASDAVTFSQKVQQVFAGIELSKMAELKAAGVSRRERERRAAAGGTRSKKSASKASKRADAVEKNPNLAADVENGSLGDEQMDAIAQGADKTNGDAAVDEGLIAKVKAAPADDATKIVSRWIEGRDDEHGTESRYDRQRRRRAVRFGLDPATDCQTMTASGDRESIAALEKLVAERAGELYKLDGGREVPNNEHPRTRQQRLFDALCQLLSEGADAGLAGGSGPSGRKPAVKSAPSVRSMIHIGVTVDTDDAEVIRASLFGGEGYLPRSVLDRYGCSSMIAGTVFDQQGEVLWFGRLKRQATPAQFAALVARDRGCVLCSADISRCEAHHLMPFNAPGQGETNVDEMALVCSDHHHLLHDEQLTLYWQLGPPDAATVHQGRVWATRSATPDEIAPKNNRPHVEKSKQQAQRVSVR